MTSKAKTSIKVRRFCLSWLLRCLGAVTRRIHPRVIQRALRYFHPSKQVIINATVRMRNGLDVLVDTGDHVGWSLFFLGEYEPGIVRMLGRLLEHGDTAIDVGAHIGVHTLSMARATRGRVIALEPNPLLKERLERNVRVNDLRNVTVIQRAALDHAHPVALHIPPSETRNEGMSSLIPLGGWPSQIVQGTTLNELMVELDLGRVGLVKIDVEGLEPAVLTGARGLIARDHPALLFEYSRDYWLRAAFDLGEVLESLRDAGYQHFAIVEDDRTFPLNDRLPEYANICATVGP